jgi:hypothetical protein
MLTLLLAAANTTTATASASTAAAAAIVDSLCAGLNNSCRHGASAHNAYA